MLPVFYISNLDENNIYNLVAILVPLPQNFTTERIFLKWLLETKGMENMAH